MKKKAGAPAKVRCENPTLCGGRGSAPNHIVGTFSQLRCAELTRRIKAGESFASPEAAQMVRPPSLPERNPESNAATEQRSNLLEQVNSWRDDPKKLLDFMSWSHRFRLKQLVEYSPYNMALIFVQDPKATQVAAQRAWGEAGRTLVEDAESILIFAPGSMASRRRLDVDGNPVLDADGKQIYDKFPIGRYRAVRVYDVSQTEGEDLADSAVSVANIDTLQRTISETVRNYGAAVTFREMSGSIPARIDGDEVVVNSMASDDGQLLANHLVGVAMLAAQRIQSDADRNRKGESAWTEAEYRCAAVAAAHSVGANSGLDMTDMALKRLAEYDGPMPMSNIVALASRVEVHMSAVQSGIPMVMADAFAS